MSKRGFWDDDLLTLQQKYWENWSELSRKALGAEALPPSSPWEMALDNWWRAVSPAAPDVAKDFMVRMMDQGKNFFRMAERFSGTGKPDGNAPDWMEVLNDISAGLQSESRTGADFESQDQLHKMMGFWELPFDNWQRLASTLSLLPGDLFKNMPHGGPQIGTDRLFSTPGLGYTREEQAQQQELMRLVRAYQRALLAYNQFFSNIGRESVQRLRDKLKQNSANGEVIDSARTLYDTWVTTCEEVYGELVRTSDYARINGQLVNASMGVKHHMSTMVDEKLSSLNMPTRREVRTLQARMQEIRRENKCLRKDLDMLKAQVADLSASQSKARPATATIKRKTVPRKKSTVKK